MIKSKKMLYVSIILLLGSMILNFPFPHRYPYGEEFFSILNIPIQFSNGLLSVGITSLVFLIVGLFLLVESTNKYHGRFVVIAIVIMMLLPPMIVNTFQKTFATGIYSISYLSEESNCSFEMINVDTLHGECDLFFTNHSKKDVQFTILFHTESEYVPMVSLMNTDAPYEVKLGGHESKHVKIETNIDVSNMESHVENGEASVISIIIQSNDKSRQL